VIAVVVVGPAVGIVVVVIAEVKQTNKQNSACTMAETNATKTLLYLSKGIQYQILFNYIYNDVICTKCISFPKDGTVVCVTEKSPVWCEKIVIVSAFKYSDRYDTPILGGRLL